MAEDAAIDLLLSHKENIAPLRHGHSAQQLAHTLRTPSSDMRQRQARERDAFEQQLGDAALDELDDPLQVYLDYLEWTAANFPMGNNAESGLVPLLERCALHFRHTLFYKNDPRYLRVWLRYSEYSDAPQDIYLYLAKRDIGQQLATYYEQFAEWLERDGRVEQAREVFQLGVDRAARPLARLQRKRAEFSERHPVVPAAAVVRPALATKRGTGTDGVMAPPPAPKRARLEVFADEQPQESIRGLMDGPTAWLPDDRLDTVETRTKENRQKGVPWAGETMAEVGVETSRDSRIEVFRDEPPHPEELQETFPEEEESRDTPRPDTLREEGARIEVFRDEASENAPTPPTQEPTPEPEPMAESEPVYTTLRVPGKKPEVLDLNLALFYPEEGEERCLGEIMAAARRHAAVSLATPSSPQASHPFSTASTPTTEEYVDAEEPAKTEDPLWTAKSAAAEKSASPPPVVASPRHTPPRSPTVTMTYFTREAQREVFGMFNERADALTDSEGEHEERNAYDITETIHRRDSVRSSSPFVEAPRADADVVVVDPSKPDVRSALLSTASSTLTASRGFYTYPEPLQKLQQLRKQIARAPSGRRASTGVGSRTVVLEFKGSGEMFAVRLELGEGGYAVVYLAETDTGGYRALKVELPASAWEFYLLRELELRMRHGDLQQQRALHLVVAADALHLYADEAYLVLDYRAQGTILDVVNKHRVGSGGVDEVLALFLTIELLRTVESIHEAGIMHGDLKPDNCMVRFEPVAGEWDAEYDPSGGGGWDAKGVTLIDFGRGVDVRRLREQHGEVAFVCDWKTDNQDCVEMRSHRPWTFQADYYGLAGIIHLLLFGSYIDTLEDGGQLRVRLPLKRYWQQHLWRGLFEVLLNPKQFGALPVTRVLRERRQAMEEWLEMRSTGGQGLKSIIEDMEL